MVRPPVSQNIVTTITESKIGIPSDESGQPATSAAPSGRGVETADVIVVGAGPGGSATAAYVAMAGLDVLLLEKSAFPREKVCGDGLTPRAVRELIPLGIPTPAEDGCIKNPGLRIIGGGLRLEPPLPALAMFPPSALVRPSPPARPPPHPADNRAQRPGRRIIRRRHRAHRVQMHARSLSAPRHRNQFPLMPRCIERQRHVDHR